MRFILLVATIAILYSFETPTWETQMNDTVEEPAAPVEQHPVPLGEDLGNDDREGRHEEEARDHQDEDALLLRLPPGVEDDGQEGVHAGASGRASSSETSSTKVCSSVRLTVVTS